MPPWILKATIQRAISILPKAELWNEVLQNTLTHSLGLDGEKFEEKLRRCDKHIEHLKTFGPQGRPADEGFTVLELGTGWYPVAPIGFYL